ncbi:MAG: hypothetical protein JKY65_04930 [Planctomycetes bacterium]|nr:hypothetical protein [Planctomycetota bacterium]
MDRVKLGDVKRELTRWRASKEWRGEPMPEALWARAVAAAQAHGRSKTARQLGLNHSVLKRRAEQNQAAPAFVELPLSDVFAPRTETAPTIEVEDAAGTRLRLVLCGALPHEVAAAARELWSARR